MAEKYTPLFKLDAGGMAEVYVAEAESMAGFKKKVAIKRILPGLLKDERFVRMFLDEARLSLHLNHANVVSVFDIGKSDDTYFIVMEYVEGTTLKKILEWGQERGQRTPVHIAVWMVNEILTGLGYAHGVDDPDRPGQRLGIVHRDISPPNILVSWKGEVKLTDFGLAKATTQLESTDPGVVKGKFAYLSPEAAQGNEVDGRTDVFAVGILAFEMLTGRRLFLGETDWQTVENVRNCVIPDMRALNPEIPEQLEAVILKALAKDLDDRYPTAEEFADELVGVMFAMGKRVSARELMHMLEGLRNQAPDPNAAAASNSGGIIAELIGEALMNFKSIDSENSPGASPLATLGAASLVDFGEDDDDMFGPPADASTTAAPASKPNADPDAGVPQARDFELTPTGVVASPTPKRERSGGGLIAFFLILLVLGGSAAYYFLVMGGELPFDLP